MFAVCRLHNKCAQLMSGRVIYSTSTIRPLSTSVDTPNVSLEFQDAVAIISLNNHLRRNALTTGMMVQLDHHVQTLANNIQSNTDTNTRVVILTGSQGTFCSGLDLTDNEEDQTDRISSSLKDGSNMIEHMTRVTNQLLSLPILSICAVDGYAVGGGAELTTCTDLVVLNRNAKIEFVHAKRGASPGWGGGKRLVKKVGRRKALRMLLLGECIYGEEEAIACEYADAVSNEGETAVPATMRYIQPVLELPCSQSIRAIKKTISSADDEAMDIAMERERESFLSVWGREANLKQIAEYVWKSGVDGGDGNSGDSKDGKNGVDKPVQTRQAGQSNITQKKKSTSEMTPLERLRYRQEKKARAKAAKDEEEATLIAQRTIDKGTIER